MPTKHDAFISYSHGADSRLAKAIEEGIERLAKPLLKIRAADVFRDETSLAANPSLWAGIEDHLHGSSWFVLLACPESAASAWCVKEVRWWLDNRSMSRMLIVLTGGHLAWNPAAGDFDWANTTSLGKAVSGKFQDEPLYLDLRWAQPNESLALSNPRFRDAVLNLAAPIRAMRKDELDGADVRQFRRNRLVVRTGVALICLVAVIAIWQAIVATRERNEAVRQTRIALARAVGSTAQQKTKSEPDVALLLATYATRLDPGLSTKSALLGALQENPRLQRLLWPDARAFAAEFDPEGKRLAVADAEGGVSIWDAAGWRRLVRISAAHENEIWAAAFVPGGKELVTASLDKTIAVWDVESGQQIGQRMTGHTDEVLSLAVSPHSRLLATAGLDCTIKLWDLDQRRVRRTIAGAHTGGVRALVFAPDGSKLVSGGFDGSIRVWNAASGEPLPAPKKAHSGTVMDLAFRPDGTLLASAGQDGAILFWDPVTWKQRGEPLREFGKDLGALAFSPDGKQLAAGGWDGVVRLWNFGPEKATGGQVFRYHKNQVWQVAFSPNGRLLASASWDGSVALWDTDGSDSFRQELSAFSEEVEALAFSPRGEVLGVGDEAGNVYLHNIQEVHERGPVLRGESGEIVGLMFSAGGSLIAAGTVDGTVLLWDAPGRTLHWRKREHRAGVLGLAFSPDEKVLISTGSDGLVIRWDIKSGQPIGAPVRAHLKGAGSAVVAFSPGGKHFASGGRGGEVILWDAASGQRNRVLLGGAHESEGVEAVAFSPDGRKLVAAKGAWLYLWEDGNWSKVGKYAAGHDLSITQIAFSADSRTLVVGGMGGGIYLWDVESKRIMPEPLSGWPRPVGHMALSSDGKYLAASFGDGYPVLWDLDLRTWMGCACRIANRDLNPVEWAELVGPFPQVSVCP